MTPDSTNQVVAELLLSGLATIVLLAIGTWFAVVHLRQQRKQRTRTFSGPEGIEPPHEASPSSYHPSVFEQACRWLAVRNSHLRAVQAALGLHNTSPCSWREGMSSVAAQKLFVSPPIRGWILVVGQGLPDPADDVDQCFHLLCRLSRTLGEVQFFSVNRALNHHAWARAERGTIRRAYAWAGETQWRQGEMTSAETAVGVRCLDYGESPPGLQLGSAEPSPPNAEKVLSLAARWSLDPTALDPALLRAGLGLAGELSRPPAH